MKFLWEVDQILVDLLLEIAVQWNLSSQSFSSCQNFSSRKFCGLSGPRSKFWRNNFVDRNLIWIYLKACSVVVQESVHYGRISSLREMLRSLWFALLSKDPISLNCTLSCRALQSLLRAKVRFFEQTEKGRRSLFGFYCFDAQLSLLSWLASYFNTQKCILLFPKFSFF